MKKILILGTLLISGLTFAQTAKPILEQEGNLVKATYYYENGKVQQQGYFKQGKLEGSWVAYDAQGNKKSIGEYTNGEKSGKWMYISTNVTTTEVAFSNNKIAAVKNLNQNAIAVKN